MNRLLTLIVLLALVGCGSQKEDWREEYIAADERWQVAYGNADARVAYDATVSFIDHIKRMERDGRPFEYVKVQTWNYARLALLADHLGKHEEARHLFATAARYAKKAHPEETEDRISEIAFRSYLDQMDTPDKVAWRKK